MSKDIRSYFATGGAKKTAAVLKAPSPASKRRIVINSSDDEISETPPAKRKGAEKEAKTQKSKSRRIIDSASPEAKPADAKTRHASKEKKDGPPKEIDLSKMFSDKPIKRVERKIKEQVKSNSHVEVTTPTSKATPKKVSKCSPEEPSSSKYSPVKTLPSDSKPTSVNKSMESPDATPVKKSPPKPAALSGKKPSAKKTTAPSSSISEHEEMSQAELDESRFEKRQMSRMLYQKFKNRDGPSKPGSKEIPKGDKSCLSGKTFLVTGILESMERDEASEVIEKFGGKVMKTVSKNLQYMVVGTEAGPAKLAAAEKLSIKQISEDELLDLIRELSGLKRKIEGSEPVARKPKLEGSEPVAKKPKLEIKTPIKSRSPKETITTEKPTEKESKRKVLPRPLATSSNGKGSAKNSDCQPSTSRAPSPKKIDISATRQITTHELNISSIENKPWVEKYKPTLLNQIIGQQGAGSNCAKLMSWLKAWYSNHNSKTKPQRPNPWAKNDNGAYYKAALLSGPPGVGKTTAAMLVCRELGFDTVEFNASDTRSKRLLKEQVSELLSCKSLHGYFNNTEKSTSKYHVLLMDEVDGMAGNEDRGGMQELIGLIKESSIPIICMCNDRSHPKIRSLVNYCYDLRFQRPRIEQIRGAMMSICFKENLKMKPAELDEIISATNQDIRQSINYLSLVCAGKDFVRPEASSNKLSSRDIHKDLRLGPWEVIRKVFSAEDHKTMSFADKSDLFFHDYSMAPLFVQQNYLIVEPSAPKANRMECVALTADSLSMGDLVDKRIRSLNAWSLLPVQAIFSSVIPGEHMAGNLKGQINFPGWLGKNSKTNKRMRLAQEIHDHTRVCTSGSRLSIRLDYAPFLLSAIVKPLKEHGLDGVAESLAVIKEYRLLREDIDSLIELTTWPGKKNPMDGVESKVKAALTRAYNKEVSPYVYSVTGAVKKSQRNQAESDDHELYPEEIDSGPASSEDEVDNKVENDVLIKAKKKSAARESQKKEEPKKGRKK